MLAMEVPVQKLEFRVDPKDEAYLERDGKLEGI